MPTDTQRLNFLATLDNGAPVIDRIGDADLFGPMQDSDAKDPEKRAREAFRGLIDWAMENERDLKRRKA